MPRRLPSRLARGGKSALLIGLCAAAAAYGVGFLLALVGDLGRSYATSKLIVLGFAAVWWSVSWYLWSAATVPEMLRNSRVAFDIRPGSTSTAANPFDRELSRWSRDIQTVTPFATAAVALLLCAYLVIATRYLDRVYMLPEFDDTWGSDPHLSLKNGVAAVWLFVFALAVVPNVVGAVQYLKVVYRISMTPVSSGRSPAHAMLQLVPSLPVAREGLRNIALFGLVGGVLWTAAAATWGAAVAVGGARSHELVPVVLFVIFGLVIFLLPQILLRNTLVRIRSARIGQLREEHPGTGAIELQKLDETVRRLNGDTLWPHGGTAVSLFALGVQLIPAVATVASDLLSTKA